ncbi:MAG: hypothetical protein DI601_09855 [Azospirillum brasilense]|nr:MAG: hypothetical protein DI601_09855 [Azospirillum brasilense]
MNMVEWTLQGVVVLLLCLALPFVWRLDRRLAALRRERPALESGTAELGEAARRAERMLERMRRGAEETDRALSATLARAEPLGEDLRFLTERASLMADRLEALVREARPLVVTPATAEPGPAPLARAEAVPEAVALPERPSGHAVPAGNAQDVPRSQAERDLLRALRLAR